MNKKFTAICLSIFIILIQILNVKVSANESEVVNLNELSTFKNRTADEVAMEYYNIFKPEYYSSNMASNKYPIFKTDKEASISSPYKAGEMNERVHQSITDMANYYRWLVGVSKFNTGYSVHNEALQTMAVIETLYFKDTNQLSHTLYKDYSKPADMDEEFWNKGKNVPHNIVAGGYFPQKSVEGFFYEGYDLKSKKFDTIGHRWTLLSKMATNGFDFAYTNGIVIGSYKNNSSGNGTTDMPIVAFPAPGYNPDRIANGNNTSWSFELGKYKLPTENSAKGISVTVENLQTHDSYVASEANGNLICQYGTNIVYQQPVPTKGSYYEGSYKIIIKGLLDERNQPKTIEYTTTFIDISYKGNTIPTSILDIEFDGLAKGLYNAQLNQKAYPLFRQPSHERAGNSVTADYVSQTLPQLEITTTTGFKQNVSAYFELLKDDSNGMTLGFKEYDKSNLDSNINDDLGKLHNYQPKLSNLFFEMVDVNQRGNEGKPFTITFKPTSSDYVPIKIIWYKVNENGKVIKVGEGNELKFDKLSLNDAGKYFFTAFDNQRGYMVMKYSAVKNLFVQPKTIKSINLIGFDKLTYLDEDELDLSNARYDIVYSDDSTEQIPVDKASISGYNASKIGSQNISFNYKGKVINKIITVQPREVSNIQIKNDMLKRNYSQGEEINPEGFILNVTYTNQTEGDVVVTKNMISDYNKDKVGNQSITITYRGKSIKYDITVSENPIRALELFKEEVKKTIENMKELTQEQKKIAKAAVDNAKNKDEVEKALQNAEKQKNDKIILEENRVRALALAKKYGAYFDNDIRLARNIDELEEALKESLKFSSKGIQKFYADRKAEIEKIEKQIRELSNLDEVSKNNFIKELKATPLSGDLEKALRDAKKANNKIQAGIITAIPVIETENITKEVIYKGETIDLSDNILNLPEGSTVVDITEPVIDTNIIGNYTAKVKVTFKGGASRIVSVPVEIKEKVQAGIITAIPVIAIGNITKEVIYKGETIDLSDNILNLPEGSTIVDITEPVIDTNIIGNYTAKVKVIFKSGASRIVIVPVEIKEKVRADIITVIPVIETENITKEVIYKGETIDLSDNILNLPEGSTIVDITEPAIDTNIVGNYTAKVKVTFKGGASRIVSVPIEIKEKVQAGIITAIPVIETENITKEVIYKGETIDLSDNILNLPEGSTIVDITEPIIDTNIIGNYTAKVKVTFKGGASRIISVPIEIKEKVDAGIISKPNYEIDDVTKEVSETDINNTVGKDDNNNPYINNVNSNSNSNILTNNKILDNKYNLENNENKKETITSKTEKEKNSTNNTTINNEQSKLNKINSANNIKNHNNYFIYVSLLIILLSVIVAIIILRIFYIIRKHK